MGVIWQNKASMAPSRMNTGHQNNYLWISVSESSEKDYQKNIVA